MGNSFVPFDVSMEIYPQQIPHRKIFAHIKLFPRRQQPFSMVRTASESAPNGIFVIGFKNFWQTDTQVYINIDQEAPSCSKGG